MDVLTESGGASDTVPMTRSSKEMPVC